jgi:hypothetical protein
MLIRVLHSQTAGFTKFYLSFTECGISHASGRVAPLQWMAGAQKQARLARWTAERLAPMSWGNICWAA